MWETETAIVAEINCDVKWDEWEKQVTAHMPMKRIFRCCRKKQQLRRCGYTAMEKGMPAASLFLNTKTTDGVRIRQNF